MTIDFTWCQNTFAYWPTSTGPTAGASFPLFVIGSLSSLSFACLLAWLWVQQRRGMRGDTTGNLTGSSPLIFPLYVKVLWGGLFATVFDTVLGVFVPSTTGLGQVRSQEERADGAYSQPLYAAALYGLTWGMYHFVFEGVALLMLNPGVGSVAAKKSAMLAGIWAVVTALVQAFSRSNQGHLANVIMSVSWSMTLVCFYACLWLLPASKLFRRPCVRNYARFWCLMRIFVSLSNVMRHFDVTVGYCFYMLDVAVFQSPTVAFVVYKCLLRDCQYWLGILRWEENNTAGEDVGGGSDDMTDKASDSPTAAAAAAIEPSYTFTSSPSSVSSSKRNGLETLRRPLLGTSLAPHSARMLAHKMDSSSKSMAGNASSSATIFSESFHLPPGSAAASPSPRPRGKGVRVLNFAFLKIEQREAASSLGRAVDRPQQVVLGSGSSCRVFQGTFRGHPVAIKMIFVPELTPESVSSFYHEATLLAQLQHQNVVEVLGVCVLPPAICLVMELCSGGNLFDFLRTHAEQNVAIPLWRQLAMALDCAAAVDFLHAQNPAVLHLDLKSLNFLLTKEGRVKVADLELSREIIIAEEGDDATFADSHNAASSSVSSKKRMSSLSPSSERPNGATAVVAGSELTGFKIPETLYWLAPELMMGHPYGSASDVYSLALVIWEIFTASVPYRALEDSLVLAARRAKFKEMTGCSPEEAEQLEHQAAVAREAREARKRRQQRRQGEEAARAGSAGDEERGGRARHHGGGASGGINGLPPRPASSAGGSGAAAGLSGGGRAHERRGSRSLSQRRGGGGGDGDDSEEMQMSTPSSAGSNKSQSTERSPLSPRYFLTPQLQPTAHPSAVATAGAPGNAAAAGAATAAQMAAVPALDIGSSQPAAPATGDSPQLTSDTMVVPLTRENLSSLDGSSAVAHVRSVNSGGGSSSMAAAASASRAVSPAALERETDPILAEWKAMHYHMHTHKLLEPQQQHVASPDSAHGGAGHSMLHSSSSFPVPGRTGYGNTASATGPVGGKQGYSVRPNLPTVPASVQNSFRPEADLPLVAASQNSSQYGLMARGGGGAGAEHDGHATDGGAGGAGEHERDSESLLDAEYSQSHSDSLGPHSYSESGTVGHPSRHHDGGVGSYSALGGIGGGQQNPRAAGLVMRSAPFQSDLSPIMAATMHHGGGGGGAHGASGFDSLAEDRPLSHATRPLPPPSFGSSRASTGTSGSAASAAAQARQYSDTATGPPLALGDQTYVQYSANTRPRALSAATSDAPPLTDTATIGGDLPADGDEQPQLWQGDDMDDSPAAAPSSSAAAGAGAGAHKPRKAYTMPTQNSFLLPPGSGGGGESNRRGQSSNLRASDRLGSGGHSTALPSGCVSPVNSGPQSSRSGTSTSTAAQSQQRIPRVSSHLSVRTRGRSAVGGDKDKQNRATSSRRSKARERAGRRAASAEHGGGGSLDTALLSDDSLEGPFTALPAAPKVRFSSVYVSRHDVQEQLRHLICHEHYRPTLPADMPDELALLLSQAWHPLPHHRPTAAEIVQLIARLANTLQQQTEAYMTGHNYAFQSR